MWHCLGGNDDLIVHVGDVVCQPGTDPAQVDNTLWGAYRMGEANGVLVKSARWHGDVFSHARELPGDLLWRDDALAPAEDAAPKADPAPARQWKTAPGWFVVPDEGGQAVMQEDDVVGPLDCDPSIVRNGGALGELGTRDGGTKIDRWAGNVLSFARDYNKRPDLRLYRKLDDSDFEPVEFEVPGRDWRLSVDQRLQPGDVLVLPGEDPRLVENVLYVNFIHDGPVGLRMQVNDTLANIREICQQPTAVVWRIWQPELAGLPYNMIGGGVVGEMDVVKIFGRDAVVPKPAAHPRLACSGNPLFAKVAPLP